MSVSIEIHDGPLPPAGPWRIDGAGAILCFDGVVRPTEAGQAIEAIDYEAYEPMAQRQLNLLAEQTLERFGLLAINVTHSRGRVPAGECSFRLRIASAHRAAGLEAMGGFIDQLKRDVPIWKRPVHREPAGGTPS